MSTANSTQPTVAAGSTASVSNLLAVSAARWTQAAVQLRMTVHEEEEYAAVLLAALLGVPCVTHSWPAPVRPGAQRSSARQRLAGIWEAYGAGRAARTSGELYLDACPPALQTAEIAQVPDVVPVQPVLFDGPPAAPPHWLSTMPRPAAYVTLGTVPVFSTPDALRRITRAVRPLVASVVVTSGPNPVGSLGELGPHVYATPYLPQSQVLGRVDVLVSHGGAGGTVGALAHGLPHLVLPLAGQSQIAAARRVQDLGVGLGLPGGHRDAPAIRSAVAELLGNQRYARRATEIGRDLRLLPTPDKVLQLLTDMANEHDSTRRSDQPPHHATD